VFPSDYVNDVVVTPLLKHGTLSPEYKISILDIGGSNSQSDPDSSRYLPEQQSNNHSRLNTTRSEKTFSNKKVNYSNSDLQKRFRNQNKMECGCTWTFLKIGALEYWGRLRFRRNIADSIWTPDLWRKLEERICEDMCRFGFHHQQAKYDRHNIN